MTTYAKGYEQGKFDAKMDQLNTTQLVVAKVIEAKAVEVAGMRKTTIKWAGTTDEQKNTLLYGFDNYNQAITDAVALIRKP